VVVALELGLELGPIGLGARLRAKEAAAHIVVDADDVPAAFTEETRCFGADEAGAAGDDDERHDDDSLIVAVSKRMSFPTGRHDKYRADACNQAAW
jgi:hypothetical protein